MKEKIEPETNGQLLARTMYLLSRAATIGVCRGRMRAVIQQLTVVGNSRDVPEDVRNMCLQLLGDWRSAQEEHFGTEIPAATEPCHCLH